jgi:1,3-beta-glucan synthase
MKQSKLRRRRVFRYAVLYFVMLVVFLGMIIGPIVAGKNIPTESISGQLQGIKLFQPTGLNNDDTQGRNMTGTGRDGYTGALKTTVTDEPARTTADGSEPTDDAEA